MARYILIAAVVGAPPRDCYRRLDRGTAIADSVANALLGDTVWPALCAAPSEASMRPLDAAGSAMMHLPITTLAEVAATCFLGVGAGQG